LRPFSNLVTFATCAYLLGGAVTSAAGADAVSDWVPADNARARLVAGRVVVDGASRLIAGVEIEMADGWKTYWRNPGSSGVPPHITWDSSRNLQAARLLFPAPDRFVDREGDTIGYKHSVMFPIELTPRDPAKPVELEIGAEFGVCKDICIPVELKLALDVPAAAGQLAPSSPLAKAVDRVPRLEGNRRANDPTLVRTQSDLTGASPRLTLEARYPGGTKGADMFIEAPDGLWIPLPKRTADVSGDVVRFQVDLSDGADVGDLKGKVLRLTLVGASGQSETTFKLE